MRRFTWYALFICVIISNGCTYSEESYRTFQEIVEVLINGQGKTCVILEEKSYGNYLPDKKKRYLKKHNRSIRFFSCDVDLPENTFLKYVFSTQSFPTAIVMSEDGRIECFCKDFFIEAPYSSLNCFEQIESRAEVPFIKLSEHEAATLAAEINANLIITSQAEGVLSDNEIHLIKSEESFYSRYLLGRYYETQGEDAMYRSLMAEACDFYLPGRDDLYLVLFEDVRTVVDLEREDLVYPENVDFGLVKKGGISTQEMMVFNPAEETAIILSIIPSCSCLEIHFPREIPPKTWCAIEITFKADIEEGHTKKSISIVSDRSRKITVVPINADVVS